MKETVRENFYLVIELTATLFAPAATSALILIDHRIGSGLIIALLWTPVAPVTRFFSISENIPFLLRFFRQVNH